MNDLFQSALADAQTGNFPAAEATLNQLLSGRMSRDAEAAACALLGVVELYSGKTDTAVKRLQRSVRLRNNNADAHSNLCNALRLQGKNLDAAVRHGRKAVTLRPDFPEALLNLGSALEEKGALDNAVAAYRKALARRPVWPAAQFGLGNALAKQGEHAAAADAFRAALAGDPGFAEAQLNLGGALEALGDFDGAVAACRAALALAPDYPEAQLNLGGLLNTKGETDAAVELFDTVIAAHPEFAEAYLGRGNALEARGDPAGAIVAYRRAVDIRPDFVEALVNLGNVLEETGDREGAVDAYNRALAIRPDFAEAHRFLSLCLRYEEGDAHLRQLRAIGKKKVAEEDRMHLEFALAKAEEDCGNYDAGFGHYAEANRLRRESVEYDAAAVARQRDMLLRLDDRLRDTGAALTAEDGDSEVIFIVGVPRCGSTLVENILSLNADVADLGETDALADAVSASGISDRMPDANALAIIRERYLAAALSGKPEAQIFTDKMLNNFLYCGLIARAFPSARIVHMARNPLDNIMSIFRNYFVTGNEFAYDLDEITAHYHMHMEMMSAWKTRYGQRIFTCEYDRLVSDPEGNIPALVEFCGFEWDDMYLEPHRNRRAVKTASMDQVRRPIYTTSVKGWKRYEQHLQPLAERLRELGYAID